MEKDCLEGWFQGLAETRKGNRLTLKVKIRRKGGPVWLKMKIAEAEKVRGVRVSM